MTTDQKKIELALVQLDDDGRKRHTEALGQGYKDEVCGECGTVLLAHHHAIRCNSQTCPMATKHPDGRPKTLFEIWDEADAKKAAATT